MLKIAIVGAGFMGGVHATNLSKLEQTQLVAVCDVNLKAAETLAAKHEVGAFSDYDEMLAQEAPDAVIICLPPFAHNGEVEKAAERGIHVFIEKPIGISYKSASSMVEAVTKYGVKSQVGYHCRFGGAVIELRKLIDDNKCGQPVLFNGRYECNALHGEWWRDESKCGSQMLEQAIHTYDMSMHLMGKPTSVNGLMDNLCHKDVEGYTIEDVSAAIIRYDSGAIGSITATNCAVPGRWENPFSVVFEKLTATFYNPNHAVFIDTTDGAAVERTVKCNNDMYLDELKSFAALLEGKQETSVCPITEGYASLKLVDDAMRSAKSSGGIVMD